MAKESYALKKEQSLDTWLRVSPGRRHNAGPDDGERQAGSLGLQDVLGQGLGEGVGVRLPPNYHRSHLGTVQLASFNHLNICFQNISQPSLSLSHLTEVHDAPGVDRSGVDFLLDIFQVAVTVGGGDVHQSLQVVDLTGQGDQARHSPDVHGHGLGEVLVKPHGGRRVEDDVDF